MLDARISERGEIPTISWYVQSEEGAQVNG